MKLKDLKWTEKYRPKSVSDVISEHSETVVKYLSDPASIPNFLFHSRTGGTGKSSLAKAIIKDLGVDSININASEERSIENIRTRVKSFVRGASSNGLKRCVFMDECEALTSDAKKALKNMIEEYSVSSFYIFTTNDVNKLDQPLRSRFVELEFSRIPKDKLLEHLMNICDKESLDYDTEGLQHLIKVHYPSVRLMISNLQDLKVQGSKVTPSVIVNIDSVYDNVWECLKNSDYNGLKTMVYNNEFDVVSFNKWLFDGLMNGKVDDLKKELLLIQSCARLEKNYTIGCDPIISFMNESINIIKVLRG